MTFFSWALLDRIVFELWVLVLNLKSSDAKASKHHLKRSSKMTQTPCKNFTLMQWVGNENENNFNFRKTFQMALRGFFHLNPSYVYVYIYIYMYMHVYVCVCVYNIYTIYIYYVNIYLINVHFGVTKIFLFLKEVSYDHKSCIYCIKNLEKTVILWTIITIKIVIAVIAVFYSNILKV